MDAVIAQHILGLRSPRVTEPELRAAWRRFARENHPDRRPDDPMAGRRFAAGHEAYEVLRGLASPAETRQSSSRQARGRPVGTRPRPRRGGPVVRADRAAGRVQSYAFSDVPAREWRA